MLVVLNLLSALLFLIFARVWLGRRGNPLLWTYVISGVAVLYFVTPQDYSLGLGLEILAFGQLLMSLFLVVVLVLGRMGSLSSQQLVGTAMTIRTPVLIVVCVVWIVVRLYLLISFGPAGLAMGRAGMIGSLSQPLEFPWWALGLSTMTTVLLLGALAVGVVRSAVRGTRGALGVAGLLFAMVLLVMLTGESPIGARRLVVTLGALWLSVAWASSNQSIARFVVRRFKGLAATAIVAIALIVYFQNVRGNDLTNVLMADRPIEIMRGLVSFATAFEPSREVEYLRPGVMDFFSSVVAASVLDGRSSNGEATAVSLALAVPRVLFFGEKPMTDVDEVLLQHLAIVPSRPFVHIDYPTSLAAIGVADFGVAGVALMGLMFGACMALLNRSLIWFRQNSLAWLFLLGTMITMVGGHESGLTSVVVGLRDAILSVSILSFGSCVWRVATHGGPVRPGVRGSRLVPRRQSSTP